MALVPYTITALAESDAQGTDGKNIVAGATCSMYSQPSDSVVTLYDDAAGSNGSTAKVTGANGQVVVYVEPGSYRVSVNAVDSFVDLSIGSFSNIINTSATSINVDDSSNNKLIIVQSASDVTITANLATAGTSVSFMQDTTSEISFLSGVGQTVLSPMGLNPYTRYSIVNITNIGNNTWLLSGDLG